MDAAYGVFAALITGVFGIVIAYINGQTRKEASQMRRENAQQHAQVHDTIKVHTNAISGLQTDMRDVRGDLRDVKDDVREMRHDLKDLARRD